MRTKVETEAPGDETGRVRFEVDVARTVEDFSVERLSLSASHFGGREGRRLDDLMWTAKSRPR